LTFSNRLPPRVDVNALSRAIASLRQQNLPFADLTESNPTTAGLDYPADILSALGDPRAVPYTPDPLGLRQAREAIACDYLRRGAEVDPGAIVLSASSSESYSWLFKLLCDPGDSVLAPQPSYPLFEHLTRLEGVALTPYPLQYHGRWEIDVESLRAAPETTRAVLLVSPNNPTGSYVSAQELDQVVRLCEERNWALIADEVFADYALDEPAPLTDLAARAGVLSFMLGGASKSLGLPQVKLGWTVVGGPRPRREEALDALALIADTYLSVGTPVQIAAAELIRRGASVREEIHRRVRRNLDRARQIARQFPACEVLRVEGGWSAPIRVPATRAEDALVLELLETERVLVYPGYFFDFPHEAYVVVSLLPEEAAFADALERTLLFVQS
jgi:aspartate/methionine/tyrosine aminotransferase